MANKLYEIPVNKIDGAETTLAEFEGKVLLLVNVASKCGLTPQYAGIEKLYKEYKDQGFVVLAVNSTVQDSAIEIPTFTAEYSLNFPILLDELGDVTRMYQVRSLPSSYFINRLGIITEVVIGGPMSEALLRTRIEEALK